MKNVFVKFPCECGRNIEVKFRKKEVKKGVIFLILRGTKVDCECGREFEATDQRFIEFEAIGKEEV